MSKSLLLSLAAAALTGCADARLFRCPNAKGPGVGDVASDPPDQAAYRVGCPDAVDVAFAGRPEWDCVAAVDVDGTLPLGPVGRARADGFTIDQLHAEIARVAAVDPATVRVTLADARAGRVYVTGPENDRQRVVPYRGPERVVEFLWRIGAVKKGCTDPHDVQVVRPNVAAGGPPQEFNVDIEAVVADGDHRTNVVLQPSDEVIVGETRRSRFSRLLPKWLRPVYRALVGVLPPDKCDCGE